ncbi:phage tail assembly protein [Pseudomonas sp. SLFW]|uniref:phage tail assembly protein n=1 Tax=Pseudomonas sp. SLFW TaxID=2683259 RepID=UPI001413760B|nr:phage tail assembly protein [Pseudomonas sp. SLFW]NBB09534.1 phage tail assembly protein [Pseudomonas sp. SLFW]
MTTLNIDAKGPDAQPRWMAVNDAGVTITLSTPKAFHGITQEKLRMRSPTVREVRACQKAHPNDDLAVDTMLFASLMEVSEKDLMELTLKDYERVKRGYFRLVDEDEV